jgi:hypothetical protein
MVKSIRIGRNLCYLSIILSIIINVISLSFKSFISKDFIIQLLFGIYVIFYFAYSISVKRNWARWVLLILVIITTPIVIYFIYDFYITSLFDPIATLIIISSLIPNILVISSLVFFFNAESDVWFKTVDVELEEEDVE